MILGEDYTRLLEQQVEILLWFTSNTLRTTFSMEYYLVMLESFYDKIREYHMKMAKIENSMSDADRKKEHETLRNLLSDWDDFIPKINERIQEIRSKRPQRR